MIYHYDCGGGGLCTRFGSMCHACMERVDDDPLAPARGIMIAGALSILLVAAVVALVVIVR